MASGLRVPGWLAAVLLIIGVVAGVIYVHSGVTSRLFLPFLSAVCLIGTVIQFAIKRKFESRTQAVTVIVTIVIWSIYIVAAIYGLA